MRVVEADHVSPDLVAAFTRLVNQLSRTSPPPTFDDLQEMVDAPGTHLLLAVDDDRHIAGSLTLVVFRIPTGVRAWVEDVVVDEGARRQGIGAALTTRAVELASAAGARTIDLTSRPSREAANRLYTKLGFERRDTNVYRYRL
ncbi:MAG TPA: GNAT family N-acetyltransferase [Acidimicrobiales bacterium]|nr:GNAT family N-acetyltransferase [Acidimicrobiales bacterium]